MKLPKRPLPFVLCASNHGSMIVNHKDYYMVNKTSGYGVGFTLLNCACFDADLIGLVCSLLTARKTLVGDGVHVIDCGANIGIHTIEWARHMVGWGEVMAIEAQERLFYALAGNIALNNCFNARARHAAVGACAGTIQIPRPDYNAPSSFGSLELRQRENNEFIGQTIHYDESSCDEVAMVAIDDFAPARVDFIKIDVEGMELEVMEGAKATIQRCHPTLLIEAMKTDRERLQSVLLAHGYKLYPIEINLLAIHSDDPIAQHITLQSTTT